MMFKTNVYFDGKVKSIAFQATNKPATLGVMAAGEYEFSTGDREKMTVVSGEMTIQLSGDSPSVTYRVGESFEVEANATFQVSIKADCAYLCEYG